MEKAIKLRYNKTAQEHRPTAQVQYFAALRIARWAGPSGCMQGHEKMRVEINRLGKRFGPDRDQLHHDHRQRDH